MEDLGHDLPLPVDFEQREQVSEPTTGPVVEFKPHGGDRVDEIDAETITSCRIVRRALSTPRQLFSLRRLGSSSS